MNYLQLCQTLRSEAGIAGNGPVTVTGQQGELGRVTGWIANAYIDIQDKRPDWQFLRGDFSFNCTIGDSSYPKATIANLANWKRDSFRVYLSTFTNEQWISFVQWEHFRDTRLRGASRTQTGRPIEFSINPAKEVILWPVPDSAYTITGEFYRKAIEFSVDADEPIFERFHLAIVFNALMRYAAYVSDASLYAHAQKEYGRLINKLENDQTQEITLGRTLA